MIACLGCGCTDAAACAYDDGLGRLVCFWTWKSDDEADGLCSSCAAVPLDELLVKMRIRAESIAFAGYQAIARGAHA